MRSFKKNGHVSHEKTMEEIVMEDTQDEQMQANDDQEEEISVEELVEGNNIVLNSLIDLLIQKGVISEEDLQKKLDECRDLGDEESDEDDSDDEGSEDDEE